MEFAAAREYLAKRLNMPTDMSSRVIATEIPAQVRAHCFFSARVAEGHVLDRLRDVSDAYGRGDIDLATARVKFKRWYDREKPGKRFEDGETLGNIASTMRLDLVMRQNAAMAAAVGRYQVSRDPDIEERWPCWRYITGPNPRPSHAELDGKVFLKSDPIWHRIYPPWDFNCNCDVEDAELPERGPDKVRDGDVAKPETGFAFDPAEAFRKFDLGLLDSTAKEDFELAYGGAFELNGNYAIAHKDLSARISSESLRMTPAEEWKNLAAQPGNIAPNEARKMLAAGVPVTGPRGENVTFGDDVIKHWHETNKHENDIQGRLRRLKWAISAVQDPREIWTDVNQEVYISAFEDEKHAFKGCVVAVKDTGEVHTYFIEKATRLDTARKGLRVEVFKK